VATSGRAHFRLCDLGLVLALLLSELRGLGVVPAEFAFWVGHPLLAPMLITGSWVPIEALLIASIGTRRASGSSACSCNSRSRTLMRGATRARS
jgi:hypothetical protein